MGYHVVFSPSAGRDVRRLDRGIIDRLRPRVAAPADDPRPSGCVKMTGGGDLWRIRVGDYRVVYAIDDRRHVVEITIVAHRRDVYR